MSAQDRSGLDPSASGELGAPMKCPSCGSTDVGCHENTRRHVHLCNACGRKDIYRGNDL